MKKRLFLTYSTLDREYAEALGSHLRQRGLILDDPAGLDFAVGEPWVEAVRREIEGADAMVAVVPESGRGTANNVMFEIGFARALEKPILAVVPAAREAGRRELPPSLKGMIVFDAENKTVESVANTLVSTLAAA